MLGRTQDIGSFMSKMPELTRTKKLLDMHTNIATALLREINERSVVDVCFFCCCCCCCCCFSHLLCSLSFLNWNTKLSLSPLHHFQRYPSYFLIAIHSFFVSRVAKIIANALKQKITKLLNGTGEQSGAMIGFFFPLFLFPLNSVFSHTYSFFQQIKFVLCLSTSFPLPKSTNKNSNPSKKSFPPSPPLLPLSLPPPPFLRGLILLIAWPILKKRRHLGCQQGG